MNNGLAGQLARQSTTVAPHIQVRALAGCGKTSSLVEGMRLVKGQTPSITPSAQQQAIWDAMKEGKSDTIRFAAFSKAIATELETRLAQYGLNRLGCEASTFHSMGNKAIYKAFGRQDPSSAKWVVADIVADMMGQDIREVRKDKKQITILNAVDRLVGLCKQNLAGTDVDSLDALAGHYDVDCGGYTADVYALVPQVLERCKTPNGRINFDDMVWLPVVHNLAVPKTDVLLVDEQQDLNRMQQELAYRAAHRIIGVGDENQAIFGFAGADAESMNRMRAQLGATPLGCKTLPLTITRRCGKAIVLEANRYVPSFEAHPSNPEGSVSDARFDEKSNGNGPLYHDLVRDGDFVLCRTNAPLVSQCFKFLRAGRKANIQGRDIGAGLVSTVEKLKATNVVDLVGKLSDWLASETTKENAKRMPSQSRIDALKDRYDCLLCFTEQAREISDVVRKIQSIFTDDKECVGIRLSSIHRSKGLEAQRVFWLRQKGTEPRFDKMKDWECQQYDNLCYVAITRAINELVYVY